MQQDIGVDASLAHLTHELVSLGLVTRSFDFAAAVSRGCPVEHAPTHSRDSAQDVLDRQHQLQQHHKARDQLVRCLWTMLSQRKDANERLEQATAAHNVTLYELDRVKAQCDHERKAKLTSQKDKQSAEAKLKSTETALAREQDRHKHARDELVKARSALQMVRTQALHDQKRREAEMASTMARLQRMTSDATQSKFVVLNAQALNVTTTFRGNNGAPKSSSKAETALLQSALDECDKERKRCEQECSKLRALIGQVDEWAESVMDIEAIARQEQFEKQRREEQDESFHIPNPHLVLPVIELAGPLHRKLGQIKLGVTSLADTAESMIQEARAELVEELERERSDRRDIDQRRKEAEQELEQARQQLVASEQLVKDFADRQLAATAAAVALPDDSDDEIVPVKQALTRPVTKPVNERKDRIETKRARNVASFLEDLGIDSPALPSARTLPSIAAASEASSRERQPVKSAAVAASKRTVDKENAPRIRVSPILDASKKVGTEARVSTVPLARSALSDILSMANSPPVQSSVQSKTVLSDVTARPLSGAAAKIAAARERALARSASRQRP
ncbi:hypothetical protein OIV83_004411 [Microbotryomycetes sp. JL201]|nr:hypothetical protein OIV83_004411 [Microbotryomycetes sp. JL201]